MTSLSHVAGLPLRYIRSPWPWLGSELIRSLSCPGVTTMVTVTPVHRQRADVANLAVDLVFEPTDTLSMPARRSAKSQFPDTKLVTCGSGKSCVTPVAGDGPLLVITAVYVS